MDELILELNRLNELAAAQNNYAKSLALLRALKAGTVLLDNVVMVVDGWSVVAIVKSENPPETPAET